MVNLNDFLNINSTFHPSSLEENNPLKVLLNKAFDQLTVSKKVDDLPAYYWNEKRYNLHLCDSFLSLSRDQKDLFLRDITKLNLSLSSFIEKSGHNYGAKMILLSESLEEKSLYSLFAAEEAIHLREFQNFMDFTPDPDEHWHPMLNPLGNAVCEGEKIVCIYIIQVLLEGFGMAHYNGLKEDCLYAPLQNVFKRILIDEARHHGAGVILAKANCPKDIEKDQIFEYTREFINALQSANWPLKLIQKYSGDFSKKELQKYIQQVELEKTLGHRVSKLRDMIKKVDNIGLTERLDKNDVFKIKLPT